MKSFQLLTTTIITAALTSGAYALPTGGVVNSGTATIVTKGKELDINQGSSKIDLNWKTFNSDIGETISFNQKTSDIAINHITGNQTSTLNGLLKAQGKVVLITDGNLVIGKTGQINVGALSAIAGKLTGITNGEPNVTFNGTTPVEGTSDNVNNYSATGTVTNNGTITTTNPGTAGANNIDPYGVTIFGNNVNNQGNITSASSIDISGNNITNSGNITGNQIVSLTNADTYLEATDGSLLTLPHLTKNDDGKTINAGGKITATNGGVIISSSLKANYKDLAANLAKQANNSDGTLPITAMNDLLAKSTINLTGVVDTQALAVLGTDVNVSSTHINTGEETAITATNNATLSQNSVITSTGDVDVIGMNNATLQGKIKAKGVTVGTVTGDINTATTSTIEASDVTLDSGRDLNLSGMINKGHETLTSSNDDVQLSAARDVNINQNASISAASKADYSGSGSIDINAGHNANSLGHLQTATPLNGLSTISITSGSDVNLAQTNSISSGRVSINSGNNVTNNGQINAATTYFTGDASGNTIPDGINIKAQKDIATGAASSMTATNGVNINSGHDLTLNGRIGANSVNLQSAHDTTFTNASTTVGLTNLSATSGNDLNVYGKLSSGISGLATHTVFTGGKISLNAANNFNSGAKSSIDASSTNNIALEINAGNYVHLDGNLTAQSNGSYWGLKITSGNNLNLMSTFNGNVGLGGAYLYGYKDILDYGSLTSTGEGFNSKALNLYSKGGNILVDKTATLTGKDGDINLEALKGNIIFNGSGKANGDIVFSSDSGYIYVGGNLEDTASQYTNGIDLYAAGEVTIGGHIRYDNGPVFVFGKTVNVAKATITAAKIGIYPTVK